MAYIDRDLLLKDIEESVVFTVRGQNSLEIKGANKITDRIKQMPTADVVEVVRCEKCVYACFQYNTDKYPFGLYACKKQPTGRAYKKVKGDFFCSYGERKEVEQ